MRIVLLCSLLSCAHLTTAESALLQCGEGSVPALSASLVKDVGQILDGVSPSWQAELDAFATQFGTAALDCAVQSWAAPATPQAMAVAAAPAPNLVLSNRQRNAVKFLGSR